MYLVHKQITTSPSIHLEVLVQQKGITAKTQALIDSGATGVLINTRFTKNKGFMTTPWRVQFQSPISMEQGIELGILWQHAKFYYLSQEKKDNRIR